MALSYCALAEIPTDARSTADNSHSLSPLGMQLFKDGKRLYCYAGNHLLRHDLASRIPHIPQAGPQHVHDLHKANIVMSHAAWNRHCHMTTAA